MARIRTIKPEFPQSESMGRVSREARYCFVLLWTIADDAGRLRGNSRMLASLLYPYDDDAPALIDSWLLELESEGCIVRYKPDGNTYIQISNWLIHQKIDRPSESKIQPPSDDSVIPRESSRNLGVGSKDQGPRIKDQGPQRFAPSPGGEESQKLCGKPKPAIDYQAVADAYNEILGARLPQVASMTEKRKRQIKALQPQLSNPSLEGWRTYFEAFNEEAKPFYFGDNNRGWQASFGYLLRTDTMIKIREGSL